MSKMYLNKTKINHSDDIIDIITVTPSWILRSGITMFLGILVLIVCLAALIHYPDIVNTQLKIYSPNLAKPVIAKNSGKLSKLFVHENEIVKPGQALAYMESTANHDAVLKLLLQLDSFRVNMVAEKPIGILFDISKNNNLGELQISYQTFYQDYLLYRSTIENGFYLKKRDYLQKDMVNLLKQQAQLHAEMDIQQRDFKLAEDEYKMHSRLVNENIETPAELRQEESKYLAKKSPLIQTESSLLSAGSNYSAKEKEILELNNQIYEVRSKFMQALNSLISQAQDWKNKYVLSATQAGKITFAGIIQENQSISLNQEVFYINPGNNQYFGQMNIPQGSLGKVKVGQSVLIKLKSYPFEEYGMLRGKINYIADVPYRDSVFVSRVDIRAKTSDMKKTVILKQGMTADVEIITQDQSFLQRMGQGLFKMINTK